MLHNPTELKGLRIIAGSLKGRRLRLPRGVELRPTAERVREALFSILGEEAADARVVDAYSGSGALGFEALSRGATSVVFIEADRAAARMIEDNAERIGVRDRIEVLCGTVAERLRPDRLRGPVDLLLADPPYEGGEGERLLERVGRGGILAADGLLVLERPRRQDPPDRVGCLELRRTARYGDSCLDFYRPRA